MDDINLSILNWKYFKNLVSALRYIFEKKKREQHFMSRSSMSDAIEEKFQK